MSIIRPLVVTLLLAAALATPSTAATLAGVDVPDQVTVDNHTLHLQGVGLRKKFIFKVYVGALYLTHPTSDGARAIAADEPKRISMFFVRDVAMKKIADAFEEDFFKSAQERLDTLKPKIDQFLALFTGEIEEGQAIEFTYEPGTGTHMTVAGTDRGVIEGAGFMEALWGVWLGDVPPSADLKKGMLGKK